MYDKKHIIEFEKYAKSYDSNVLIQKKVAEELVKKVNFTPKTILDIGCGTGEIYKNISWKVDRFVGVDCSSSMCELHPKAKNIEIFCDDFESPVFLDRVREFSPFDLIISSSSLQWAKDIKMAIKYYSELSDKVALAIFTSGTFKTIYKITNRKSFLPSCDSMVFLSKFFKKSNIERRFYKVYFDDTISMLRHIKLSGTSGGNRVLNYKEIKYLLKQYPYDYLEFEVVFIVN